MTQPLVLAGPVHRITIVDLSRARGAPFADGESAYFLSISRNKESVTLHFKHVEGRRSLALDCDRDRLGEPRGIHRQVHPDLLEREGRLIRS